MVQIKSNYIFVNAVHVLINDLRNYNGKEFVEIAYYRVIVNVYFDNFVPIIHFKHLDNNNELFSGFSNENESIKINFLILSESGFSFFTWRP